MGMGAPFRLQPDGDATYSHQRHTSHAGVAYHVRGDIAVLVSSNRYALSLIDDAVESLHREQQRSLCDGQLRSKQWQINEARRQPKGLERDDLVKVAEARSTPACEVLLAKYAETRSASEAFKAGGAAKPQNELSSPGYLWRVKTLAERVAETPREPSRMATSGGSKGTGIRRNGAI